MTTQDDIACPAGSRVVDESSGLAPHDVSSSAAAIASAFARDASATGICVADGMGVRIIVDRGALEVHDGMGQHRRTRRFDKATHGLRRLVVIGSTGLVTLDALNWCRRLGIGVLVLAPDGTALLASTPRMTDDARLRRIQAQAPDLPVGLDLARGLIADKLVGQAKVLTGYFAAHDEASTVADLVDALASAESVEEIRGVEAAAASVHWQTWAGRPECVPRFATRDRSHVPGHWTRFEGRRSVLASANQNRKAERPLNAVLNYLYALAEAEAMFACQAVGLDPGLGLIHNDTKGRQSLALDLIEPVRPQVDAFVLDLLGRRTFRKVEFTETTDGHCRIKAPLTHELAETVPRWSQALGLIAETMVHTLGQAMAGKYIAVTPLTGTSHRQAQAVVKARKSATRAAAKSSSARQRASEGPAAPWNCPDCGGQVTNHRHVRCDQCIAADPRQTAELRGRRGAAIAARKQAQRKWEVERGNAQESDSNYFRREILPALAQVKLGDIMTAAGLSKGFASQIRAGKFTPHASTWEALAALTNRAGGTVGE
jgi:CRISPR-associated endonuclease Cas1